VHTGGAGLQRTEEPFPEGLLGLDRQALPLDEAYPLDAHSPQEAWLGYSGSCSPGAALAGQPGSLGEGTGLPGPAGPT